MMENKSLRGKLVSLITESVATNHLFGDTNEVKNILQESLDMNLGFTTKVLDIRTVDSMIMGDVYFEDEKEVMSVINFTIFPNKQLQETI